MGNHFRAVHDSLIFRKSDFSVDDTGLFTRNPPSARMARAINSLVLMVGSYFVGAHILNFFGISLPVVQLGGGLIVVSDLLSAICTAI